MTQERVTKQGLWDRRSGAQRAARELARIVRAGKCKPGRRPKRGPRTRGENFQHWRMRHGVSAGDMAKHDTSHELLCTMFRFERGAQELTSRELMPIAHAVLRARDRKGSHAEAEAEAVSA